jgi:hypothetical protein
MNTKWELVEDGYTRECRLVEEITGRIVGGTTGSSFNPSAGWLAWYEDKDGRHRIGYFISEANAKQAVESAQPSDRP